MSQYETSTETKLFLTFEQFLAYAKSRGSGIDEHELKDLLTNGSSHDSDFNDGCHSDYHKELSMVLVEDEDGVTRDAWELSETIESKVLWEE